MKDQFPISHASTFDDDDSDEDLGLGQTWREGYDSGKVPHA